MEVIHLDLPARGRVDVALVGPSDGDPLLYFHSPATAGEEMIAAASTADELKVRLLSLQRPSIESGEHDFVNTVAECATGVIDALGVEDVVLVGWSGGAPYALAAAICIGDAVADVHLVSPIPGPLTGPEALPNQTDRLREVAATNASSSWVAGPATLRDYRAVASPWRFDLGLIARHVTIWAPSDDEIVPPRLAQRLTHELVDADVIEVPGSHNWLLDNWSALLVGVRDRARGRIT